MTANLNGPDVSRDAMRDALTASGLTPHFEWIRVDTLKSPEYQRNLSVPFAKRIAVNFDPDLFWPIIVSRRADGDYVLDGQHRLHAVRDILNWRDQNVPCEVYTGLSVEMEAKLFGTQAGATKRHLNAMERLHAAIVQKQPVALGIELTVRRAGLTLARTNAGNAPGTVRAAKALEDIYRGYGPARLLEILTLLRDTFGLADAVFQIDMLKGLNAFLLRYAEHEYYDRAEFVRKLKDIPVSSVIGRGIAIATGLGHTGGAQGGTVGRAMHIFYNSGKRSKQLPEWQERVPLPEQVRLDRDERASETNRRQYAQGTRKPAGFAAPRAMADHAAD